MKLYSYVVARDFGFAPNPFFNICTLATCKPDIREHAECDDWVVGTGSKRHNLDGRLVFAMRVTGVLTFDQYWKEPKYLVKRPILNGSVKQRYGDNIYHRSGKAKIWTQLPSHHSHSDGSPNQANIANDTKSENVLLGEEFIYWGASGPKMPSRFRQGAGLADICCTGQGHKCNFESDLAEAFVAWIRHRSERGLVGLPADFRKVKNLT